MWHNGKKRDRAILRAAVHDRDDSHAITHQVGVREHDTLGLAGGPARVDKRGEIVRMDRRDDGVESQPDGGLFAQEGFAEHAQVRPARRIGRPLVGSPARGRIIGIDVLQRGQPVRDGRDLIAERLAGGKDELRARVGEDELEFIARQRRVNRDMHRAELQHRKVDEIPFRPVVFGDVCHAVAGADPGRAQSGGEGAHGFRDFLRGIFAPCPVHLARERVRLRIMRELVRENIEDARRCR